LLLCLRLDVFEGDFDRIAVGIVVEIVVEIAVVIVVGIAFAGIVLFLF
jgi:hypothetical protein